jgi:dipeptidyl-peptidase-4
MEWIGDSGELALEYLNRPQNTNQVYIVTAKSGDARLLFEDRDAAWVDVVEQLDWLSPTPTAPKTDLLWLSERDGWRHAYLVSRATGQPRLITNFSADVIQTVALDRPNGFLYFMASPGDPIRTYLYRSRLDGTGTPERVTPADQTGSHSYDISPDGKWGIHAWSSTKVPPRYELVSLPAHTAARTLVTNDELAANLAKLNVTGGTEFTETPVSGGITLSTSITYPPNFDPSKRYPILTFVYGEPASALVRDAWRGRGFMPILASRGYVILSFDNQGTPAPRGRAWRKAGYGAIGILSTQQQAEAIHAFAASHSWVDTTRMAIYGHSGGGTNTLNMMFRNPGLYSTGISGAPVPDQAHYDSIYQERYMGVPKDNPKGYHDAAAINSAEGLTGNLLILHGSGDDNVHFQGTELLVNRLLLLGKTFDFMDYPNRTHCLCEGRGTTVDEYSRIDRFLEEHVPAGPR